MKTRKMTKAKAQELVKGTRYLVFTEDESRQLQTKLFEIGCKWQKNGSNVSNTEYHFLFVNENLVITYGLIEFYKDFETSSHQYVQANNILNIEIEKSKFDPKTLQDFDKVLVRDEDTNKWRLSFFDTYESGCFCCIDYCYKQCVPYNEETKHLKGTTEEAPDFYNIW